MAKGESYEEFVNKFKIKKTTDDCYTPPHIYEKVKEWAVKEYNLGNKTIERPFYPGGDYINYNYTENSVVIDNPPFSILSKIVDYYNEHNIKYFLFAPHLTLFTLYRAKCHVVTKSRIIYENGARVATSFVTNLEDNIIRTAPNLAQLLTEPSKKAERYKYPPNVMTTCNIDVTRYVKIPKGVFVRTLESMKPKNFYGGGYLVSDKYNDYIIPPLYHTKEFVLSEKELKIIKELNEESNDRNRLT